MVRTILGNWDLNEWSIFPWTYHYFHMSLWCCNTNSLAWKYKHFFHQCHCNSATAPFVMNMYLLYYLWSSIFKLTPRKNECTDFLKTENSATLPSRCYLLAHILETIITIHRKVTIHIFRLSGAETCAPKVTRIYHTTSERKIADQMVRRRETHASFHSNHWYTCT